RNVKPFVEILTDLTSRLEIDPARLKEIIAETATRLESSLANLGFQFAILLAQSKLTSEGALNERLQGIRMLHSMRELAKLDEQQLGAVIDELQAIRTKLFRAGAMQVVVTCEESTVASVSENVASLVGSLPAEKEKTRGPKSAAQTRFPKRAKPPCRGPSTCATSRPFPTPTLTPRPCL